MKSSASILVSLSLVVSTACVTRSKYDSTVAKWQGDLSTLQGEHDKYKVESAAELLQQRDALATLEKEKRAELAELQTKYDKMKGDYAGKLEASQDEIEALQKHRAKIEKSLAQFRKLQEAFEKMIGAGEIRVYRRRGRIMVALPSSVLFRSGKARLSSAGQTAVAKVGAVLAKLPDRRFLVAGHTDNVPIKTSKFRDNWDLSSARAVIVTRFMVANGVNPKMLASAAYGEFDPLGPNNSRDARQANRRIEIILMPNIDELPGIPDTK